MDKTEYRAVIKFFVKKSDCSWRGVFCRSYKEPL